MLNTRNFSPAAHSPFTVDPSQACELVQTFSTKLLIISNNIINNTLREKRSGMQDYRICNIGILQNSTLQCNITRMIMSS